MEPILVTSIEKDLTNAPVLIIDQEGTIGLSVSERIQNELPTVLVSSKQPTTHNVIHIPYKHRFPEIPNGLYSCILFISSNEKDLPDLVKKCSSKAKQDNIPFVFISNYQTVHEHLIQHMIEFYEQSTAVILGELFGHGNSSLDQYIIQAGTTKSLSLPYMGLRKTYPVLFADAIQGILQSVFGIQRHNRIVYLYQQHPMTDLSIAHLFQKKDPLLHIDFLDMKKKKIVEDKKIALHGFYFFDEKYPLQEKLLDAYSAASTLQKEETNEYVHKEEFLPILNLDERNSFSLIPENAPPWVKQSIISLLFFVLLPYIFLLLFSGVGLGALSLAQQAITSGKISESGVLLLVAKGSFFTDRFVAAPVLFELRIMNMRNTSYQLDKNIMIGQQISGSVLNMINSFRLVQNIISGKSTAPEKDALAVVSTTNSTFITLQNLIAANPDNKWLSETIDPYQNALTLGAGVIPLLPDALSVKGKHTYLILLQDNSELRPGGGFISNYGIVTFDHGKMGDLVLHNVYDADSRLRQHVDPQFALRRYMGTVHLYLHDSNFDVDFVADAKKASEIYQLETGQKIDGVVGLDLTCMQMLLAATGPLTIQKQNIIVNQQNFLSLVEQHADKEDSLHKQTFVADVFNTIQTALRQRQPELSILANSVLNAIQEKHLLFALANISDQNVLTVNHVSSSLWDPRGETSGTINDYMGISEGNIGNNKANFFIKRSLKQSVSIDGEGDLTGSVELTYTNTSKLGEWPGGDYKDYLRIILPQDTTLQGVAFDGQMQATQSAITDPIIYESKGFTPPQTLEIEQTREEGKTLYGFPITIPATTTRTVTITYAYNQKINLANPVLHYRLSLFKQPGTEDDPYSFAFNFPLAYTILSASPSNEDGSSDYSLYTRLSSDQTISIDLTKK